MVVGQQRHDGRRQVAGCGERHVENGAQQCGGPDFFRTLGVPVLAGRDFADSDTATSPHVGIINELFAKRFLPNQNPLGHNIGTDDGKYQMTIVGVVKDHKYRSIDEEPIPMAWYMYAQIPITGKMHVELRVHGEPLAILPAARKAVQQMDPNLPLIQPMTQQAQYETTISQQLLFARLAGFFGLLAVVARGDRPVRHAGLSREQSHGGNWRAHGGGRAARAGGVDGAARQPDADGDRSGDWRSVGTASSEGAWPRHSTG